MYRQLTPLSEILALEQWPIDFFRTADVQNLLDSTYVVDYQFSANAQSLAASIILIFEGEVAFEIPGLSGVSVVVGVPEIALPEPQIDDQPPVDELPGGVPDDFPFDPNLLVGWTQLSLGFNLTLSNGNWSLSIYDLTFEFRFEDTILKPADENDFVSIAMRGDITFDQEFNVTFKGFDEFDLSPCEIGDFGLILSAQGVTADLSRSMSPAEIELAGFSPQFIGLFLGSATIQLPETVQDDAGSPILLEVLNFIIGDGGIGGTLSIDLPLATRLFGFQFELKEGTLVLEQNSITQCSLAGVCQVPFFDQDVDLMLGFGNDGSFYAALSQGDEDGLFVLDIPFLGTFTLSSLGFDAGEAEPALLLSGILQLQVLNQFLQWPAIELQELRISAGGEVQLPDGWLDLQEPVALDLFGFRLEITRLGFGSTDDGRRWVGFSGGVALVDFLPTGVSVEGLRVIWDPAGIFDIEITLQGVGVELTLPGVLQFAGDVAFVNEESVSYFQGNARLNLLPLGIELDASLKIGRDLEGGYKFVYTFLSLELPIGIPLWATGAALYGIAGLYGMNVNPTAKDSDWYGWYAGSPEPYNVTNAGKWAGLEDGKALGAGLTLGTLFDLGRVVSVKGLFALILPGPVILLHGMANFLNTPPDASEPSSQGVFNALAVLDALAGDLQINIDAGWSKAQVIDISASAEAYFNFANPRNWHFYLGQDTPQDRRIRADFIGLFHADAYLMIDMDGIATGASISWGYDWKFGPVKVILRAWIGAEAEITWQPPQLEGSLQVGGEFEISVAGFGIGLGAEAGLAGKAPSLYWVKGELEVSVKLPTPLKDLEETIVLEWREDNEPASEDPFRSIAVEHPKVDETWTDVVETNLYDPDSAQYDPGPLVPLDARPSIVFDRSMHDVTLGNPFTSVDDYPGGSQIGGYTFDYELQEVLLEKWSKAGSSGWTPVEELYGTWMAVEDGEGEPAFTRLQLWAKSPFAFTRQTSRTYRDAFLANHAHWPCADLPEYTVYCVDWEDVDLDTPLGPSFERGGLHFILWLTDSAAVAPVEVPVCDTHKALHIAGSWKFLWIVFPEPAFAVELCLDGLFVAARSYANGELLEQVIDPGPGLVAFQVPGIDAIGLWIQDDGLLFRVCWLSEAEANAYSATFDHILSLINGLNRWDSQDEILEPETWYRLTVRQETVRTDNGSSERTPYTHCAYFQTGGPPGLVPGWTLDELEPVENGAESTTPVPYPLGGKLTNLKEYIQCSIPADGAQPVYRAYDLGAEFNENYVEQMYGADMGIRLLDANALPVRDAEGNEVQFPNQWAEQPTAELSETEYPYTSRVEDCLELPDVYYFPDQKILFANGILLEEDFSGDLDQWSDPHPEDGGVWVIAGERLEYNNRVLPVLGALLVAGEAGWADYAVEITLSDSGDDVGVACRYTNGDAEAYYRLRLNGFGRFLEKVVDGEASILWEDAVSYEFSANTRLTLHCQGARLRGQLDDELLFDLVDEAALLSGQVGIFTNSTAAFEHFLVRVWPGSALAPQTMYRADLMASHVLLVGGLVDGWTDASAYTWVNLTRNNTRLAAVGREDWDHYRVEVNAAATGQRIGLIARFQQDASAGTYACYRLYVNPDDQRIVLARLNGTFDLEVEARSVLWDCAGEACGIDFALDSHTLALSCEGDWLIVEIDGTELARKQDPGGLSSGKAGLYYIGADDPDFSELVIRSAPRQPVFGWQFVTSRYAGFVEHLDSFQGVVYLEEVSGVNRVRLENKVNAAAASLSAAWLEVAASRALLAGAGPDEVTTRRLETQAAVATWMATASAHFDTLYGELLGDTYRPLPPVVELSQVTSGTERYALLLESPEPLDWPRLEFELRQLDPVSAQYLPLAGTLAVWSNDGTRALLMPADGTSMLDGDYELQLRYNLDIGPESPLLRRGGSTLPEIGRLRFTIA